METLYHAYSCSGPGNRAVITAVCTTTISGLLTRPRLRWSKFGRNMTFDDVSVVPISSAEGLRANFTSELDKIGTAQDGSSHDILQQIVLGWSANVTDRLPDALIYPARRDPAKLGQTLENSPEMDSMLKAEELSGSSILWEFDSHPEFDAPLVSMRRLDERSLAVLRVLRELMDWKDERLEIFMIKYDGTLGGHGQETLQYLDLLGRPRLVDFNMPRLDVLSSSHSECDVVGSLSFQLLEVGIANKVIAPGFCAVPQRPSGG